MAAGCACLQLRQDGGGASDCGRMEADDGCGRLWDRTVMHVVVQIFMAKFLTTICNHFSCTVPHGPVIGCGVPLVGWDPWACPCAPARARLST